MQLIEKELKHGDIVFFDPMDSKAPSKSESYGRAEFTFCLVWSIRKKRPILERFFIHHEQQRNIKYFYRVECYADSFSVDSWTHRGIDIPKVWLHSWCKEHKGPWIRAYVPPNSNCFTISSLSTASVNFDYKEEKCTKQ